MHDPCQMSKHYLIAYDFYRCIKQEFVDSNSKWPLYGPILMLKLLKCVFIHNE